VRPLRTLSLNAPMSGGDLRIVSLPRNGTVVRKGDVVLRFDPTTVQRTVDEKRSELRQAQAEIDRQAGDARVRDEQDVTDVGKARYDVERARLDVGTQDVISRVEYEKFKLVLADAERTLREAEARLDADRRGSAADRDSRIQKRDKATLDVAKAERDLASLALTAPSDGTISLLTNWRASGAYSNGREFREGDRAWPGVAILELPDLRTVEVLAMVDEADRGRIREGQAATIRVDALPDRELRGRVAAISTLAKVSFDSWPAVKHFEVRLQLAEPDGRLKSGMAASVSIAAERLERQVIVPVAAVFQKDGRQVAYVRGVLGWKERTVVVARRGEESLVVSSGLAEGERVALRDPIAKADAEGGGR
jgi:multidrug resistance efflux pump